MLKLKCIPDEVDNYCQNTNRNDEKMSRQRREDVRENACSAGPLAVFGTGSKPTLQTWQGEEERQKAAPGFAGHWTFTGWLDRHEYKVTWRTTKSKDKSKRLDDDEAGGLVELRSPV